MVLVKKWGYAPSGISSHSYFGNVTFTVQASDFSWSNVPYGTYQLVPICLLDDEAEWKLCDMNQPEYVEAQYAEDGTLTLDSVRFHARMGYTEAGHYRRCGYKFGRWYDMVWMEKMIGAHRPNQPSVRWPE